MTAALVIGKFYPPHRGHIQLIRTALDVRRTVVVLCLGSASDTYTPADRLLALLEDCVVAGLDTNRIIGRSGYDETPFDLADPAVWSSHVQVFMAMLCDLPPVDTVVTSEAYGPRLADLLAVTHTPADPQRVVVPGSSTEIRADPLSWWNTLGAGTRRLLSTRVVVLGAESTGTSTVAASLAKRLRGRGRPWTEVALVPEYGRALTERKQLSALAAAGTMPMSVAWEADDFVEVVQEQSAMEEAAAAAGGPVLVCDTDSFATPVWERRYLGDQHAHLDPSSLGRGDVYLLTHHAGVPFFQDGTRDGAHVREQMTSEFAEALARHAKPFAVLTGTLLQRLELAERIVDHVMRRKLTFEEPI